MMVVDIIAKDLYKILKNIIKEEGLLNINNKKFGKIVLDIENLIKESNDGKINF